MTYAPATPRREVLERAGNRCEYRLLPAEVAFFPREVDHVIAEKHGRATDIDNLAFARWRCNRHKGSDLTRPAELLVVAAGAVRPEGRLRA